MTSLANLAFCSTLVDDAPKVGSAKAEKPALSNKDFWLGSCFLVASLKLGSEHAVKSMDLTDSITSWFVQFSTAWFILGRSESYLIHKVQYYSYLSYNRSYTVENITGIELAASAKSPYRKAFSFTLSVVCIWVTSMDTNNNAVVSSVTSSFSKIHIHLFA